MPLSALSQMRTHPEKEIEMKKEKSIKKDNKIALIAACAGIFFSCMLLYISLRS